MIYVYLATAKGKALGHGLYLNRGLCLASPHTCLIPIEPMAEGFTL